MPSLIAEFSHAPPSVKEVLDQIQKKHNEHFASILQGKIAQSAVGQTTEDPRPASSADPDPSPASGVELAGPENETALRQNEKIICDVKCFDNRALTVLVAESGHAWLLLSNKEQPTIVKRGTKIAGVGSGKMSTLEDGKPGVVVQFPDQDKTLVEAVVSGQSDEDNEARVKKGSLYMVAKEMLKLFPSEKLLLTGHDITIRPVQEGQTHGFDISKQTQSWGFTLKDKEVTSWAPGSAARTLVEKKVKLHPAAGWLWRFSFDKVHAKFTAKKPFLVLVSDVKLSPGKPVKLTSDP